MKDITITIKGKKTKFTLEEAKDIFYQLRPTALADDVKRAVEDEGEYQGLSKKKIRECTKQLSADIECVLDGYFDDAVSDAVQEYV